MTALYVTYSLESQDGGQKALTIHLQQREGEGMPTHEPLRELHKAVDLWSEARPEIFVRSDLGADSSLLVAAHETNRPIDHSQYVSPAQAPLPRASP